MNHINKLTIAACFVLAGCQTVQDPYVISGNTISYQHKSDVAAINKANADASAQCVSLGYKVAKVAHNSCSAGDCVTKFTCEQ
jgi:hypothetical protein